MIDMLRYEETVRAIYSLEKSIRYAEKEESQEQSNYVKHCKRLLRTYVFEHREAAKRENEYAIR